MAVARIFATKAVALKYVRATVDLLQKVRENMCDASGCEFATCECEMKFQTAECIHTIVHSLPSISRKEGGRRNFYSTKSDLVGSA